MAFCIFHGSAARGRRHISAYVQNIPFKILNQKYIFRNFFVYTVVLTQQLLSDLVVFV